MQTSDAELLIQSRTSAEAFGLIYERHARAVHRFLARRVGQQPADDLLGDVFVAAVEARLRATIHASGSALPWLYGIAKNVIRTYLRARPARAELPDGDDLDWAAVDARVDAESQRGRLRAALAGLAPSEREVLLLVTWEQLTVSEAAEALGISQVAARSRLHRARARASDSLTTPHDTDRNHDHAH